MNFREFSKKLNKFELYGEPLGWCVFDCLSLILLKKDLPNIDKIKMYLEVVGNFLQGKESLHGVEVVTCNLSQKSRNLNETFTVDFVDATRYFAAALWCENTDVGYNGQMDCAAFFAAKATQTFDSAFRLYHEAYNKAAYFCDHYKTNDTKGLAEEIFHNKEFALMPILADALIDAGCPEKETQVVRNGIGLSNWALYNLIKR